MATPRGILSIPVFSGSGEQTLVAASVPTNAWSALMRVQSASIVWTDQPTQLASILTASSGILMAPADVPLRFGGSVPVFRFRDLGANGILVMSFYEANAVGI